MTTESNYIGGLTILFEEVYPLWAAIFGLVGVLLIAIPLHHFAGSLYITAGTAIAGPLSVVICVLVALPVKTMQHKFWRLISLPPLFCMTITALGGLINYLIIA